MAELRKHEAWRAIPVVVLTAKDVTPEDKLRHDGNVKKIFQKGALTREELAREIRLLAASTRAAAPPAAGDAA